MTNEEIVSLIQTGKDPDGALLTELWLKNIQRVKYIVRRLYPNGDIDDSMQEAFIGLWNATKSYNSSNGALFLTYARYHISAAILDLIKKNNDVSIPVNLIRDANVYKKAVERFEVDNGHKPSINEITTVLGYLPKEQKRYKYVLKLLDAISLNTVIPGSDGLELSEAIPDGSDQMQKIEDDIDDHILSEYLWGVVADLPQKQADAIQMFYRDGLTLEQIAAEKGVTLSAIAQARDQGIRKIRYSKAKRILADMTGTYKYYHGSVSSFNNTGSSSTEYLAMKRIDSLKANKLDS